MVNTGRPSPGCATCKQRKIKCDLVRPACSQCLKSKWTCPGVPSKADLVFRHQTLGHDRARSSSPRHQSQRNPVQQHDFTSVRSLSVPLQDRATSFFIHHYAFTGVDTPVQPFGSGLHEYIPKLLQQQQQQQAKGDVLATITAAAGLAALANTRSSTKWRSEAYQMYGAAIYQLKCNLADPQLVKSDRTLAAVMLMGMFEVIASGDLASMKSFGHHTIGAGRCVEVRGPEQFARDDSLCYRLFHQFRRVIVMTCHQLQEPIPDSLIKCSRWASDHQCPESRTPGTEFYYINERLAAVRAEIKHKAVSSPAMISQMLLPIDDAVEEWRRRLPESWLFKSYRDLSQSSATQFTSFTSQYDVYPDLDVASLWNSYRSVRLLIHEAIIAATVKLGSSEEKEKLGSSMKVLRTMADGVCCSVRYHLVFYQNKAGHKTTAAHSSVENDGNQLPPAPGGYLLMWPLFLSGMLRSTPTKQRLWIASVLQQIGLQMGLKLAISMSDALKYQASTFSASETWIIGEFYPS